MRSKARPRPLSLEKEYEQIKPAELPQPKYERVDIGWKKEPFHQLEMFLNSISHKEYVPLIFGFKLSLTEDLVKYDVNKLKSARTETNLFTSKI